MDTREGGTSLSLTPHVLYAAGKRGGRRSNDKTQLPGSLTLLGIWILAHLGPSSKVYTLLAQSNAANDTNSVSKSSLVSFPACEGIWRAMNSTLTAVLSVGGTQHVCVCAAKQR